MVLDRYAYERGITLDYSRPGKPTDNPFIESFNGSLRDECLNTHWLLSLADAREKIEFWRADYSHFRQTRPFADRTPAQFMVAFRKGSNLPTTLLEGANDLGIGSVILVDWDGKAHILAQWWLVMTRPAAETKEPEHPSARRTVERCTRAIQAADDAKP